MSASIDTGGSTPMATFECADEALLCLPAMTRILRKPLRLRYRAGEVTIPLPRGCYYAVGAGHNQTPVIACTP